MIWTYFLFIGAGVFLTPLLEVWRKFGDLSDENMARFIAEMSIEQRYKLCVAVETGIAMILFSMFMLTRPQ